MCIRDRDDPFADFIAHEAAHIFHNCKRATIGLSETRTKEWSLDIEYRKRETFVLVRSLLARFSVLIRNNLSICLILRWFDL